jgi:transposase InsO family protein
MGQTPDRRRIGQKEQLDALGQPKHGKTDPARCRTLAPNREWVEKRGPKGSVRTAEAPGQCLNIDLCFVPASHETAEKLPAVSGSSGRLVIEELKDPAHERHWPGQVFADASRDYTEAMWAFVAASQEQTAATSSGFLQDGSTADPTLKETKRTLRQEETELRDARRAVREQRRVEDAAWQVLKTERRAQKNAASKDAPSECKAQDAHWRALRRHRKEILSERKEVDQAWKQERLAFRQRWSQLPIVTAWIAILVITDNCTRQCLGLPLFVAGARVTSEMIVEALTFLLPPDLLFLISDRGTHFTADVFETFMRSEEFIHVLIARHRPQSNGIAERFVRSLKEWLRDKSWHDDHELAALLHQFLAEYNDRPHQGLSIPGLSPNEFANRLWLF